jgi:hypothetical protein
MLALSIVEGFPRGVISLHALPHLGRKSSSAKSRVSISSKLIEIKGLQMALLRSAVKRKAWDFLFASKASNLHKTKEFVGAGLAPPAVAAPPKLNLDEDVNRATSNPLFRSLTKNRGERELPAGTYHESSRPKKPSANPCISATCAPYS